MIPLFKDGAFLSFGPSAFQADDVCGRTTRIEGDKPSVLRGQLRALAPKSPGVYGMLDRDEQLLYVGKAKNLRVRLQSYFRRKGRPARASRLIARTQRIVWEIAPNEFASLLRELELIRRWRPQFNVQGQPLRRRLTFLCVGRAPAPYVYLSRRITPNVQAAFGPLTTGPRAQDAVRRLNDFFRLRDCPQPQEMIFPDQLDLFDGTRDPGCLRMEIGACLGPCTGTCPRADYQQQVRQVRDFLSGADLSLLQKMQDEMQAAAIAEAYERAAAWRDRLLTMQWLADRLSRIRKAQQEMSFIYMVPAADGQTMWYLIHGARAVAAFPTPTCAKSQDAAAKRIEAVYRSQTGLLDSYEHADGMMVVMQWFRKHPKERSRCWAPDGVLMPKEPRTK